MLEEVDASSEVIGDVTMLNTLEHYKVSMRVFLKKGERIFYFCQLRNNLKETETCPRLFVFQKWQLSFSFTFSLIVAAHAYSEKQAFIMLLSYTIHVTGRNWIHNVNNKSFLYCDHHQI